ncbi:hypothetical protein KAR91_72885 [Candidatus Pacearchaeota archaeon]|nr:hypothetical protein [Candidatus Pacearchaeota archaeon]
MSLFPVWYHVTKLLSDAGFGTPGTDLNGGEWIADVNKQILVIDGVGVPSELKTLYEHPSVQILVRGEKYESDLTVYQRAKQIYNFMVSLPESNNIEGVCYKGFEPSSTLGGLGKDSNELFAWSMNFSTYRNVI